MHPIVILLGYFSAVLIAGSLFAFPLYLLNITFELNYGFEKVLSRSIVLSSVVLLWPLIRYLDLKTLGLARWNSSSVWRGAFLGVAVVLPVTLVIFALEIRVLDPRISISLGMVVSLVLFGGAAGLVVGFIEEVIFRGVVFSLLNRCTHAVVASVLTSLLYAVVHFLGVPEDVVMAEVGWLTGFDYLSYAFTGLADPGDYWDSFVALFLLGLALNWVRVRGNLYWCVGIHAGFVMVIHVAKALSVRSVINPYNGLVGSYDHFTGHLVSLWLVVLAVVVALWLFRRSRAVPATGPG